MSAHRLTAFYLKQSANEHGCKWRHSQRPISFHFQKHLLKNTFNSTEFSTFFLIYTILWKFPSLFNIHYINNCHNYWNFLNKCSLITKNEISYKQISEKKMRKNLDDHDFLLRIRKIFSSRNLASNLIPVKHNSGMLNQKKRISKRKKLKKT